MKTLITKIQEIAEQNPQGFTVYIPSLESVKNGWVIANVKTQNCFGESGLKKLFYLQ